MKKWIIYSVIFAVSVVGVVYANDDDECEGLTKSCAAACAKSCAAVVVSCPPQEPQVTHCRHFRVSQHGPSKGHLTARCWIVTE